MGSVATLEAAGGLGTLRMPTEGQDHRFPSSRGWRPPTGRLLGPDPGLAFPTPCSGLLATRVQSFNPGGQAGGLPRNSTW